MVSQVLPSRFRKKPVEIEAMQWDGTNEQFIENWFMGYDRPPTYTIVALNDNTLVPEVQFRIETLEGTMKVLIGDWIIRGTQGEFYPCKPEIFTEIYEAVE